MSTTSKKPAVKTAAASGTRTPGKAIGTKAVVAKAAPAAKPVPPKAIVAVPPVTVKTAPRPAPSVPTQPKLSKPAKIKKPKLVRDSFTIPKAEYSVLVDLKERAAKLASPAKKSELLRAGVKALAAMSDAAFVAALKAVPMIKTGRPAKSKQA